MRRLFLCGLALLCCACADTVPGKIFQARASYDAAVLTPLVSYAKLPACAAGVSPTVAVLCHDPAALVKLRGYDTTAQSAWAVAQGVAVQLSLTVTPAQALSDAIAASNVVFDALFQYGVISTPIPHLQG